MNILEKIITHKKQEIAERKSLYPTKLLEQSIYFETTPVSLRKYLLHQEKSGIIAEFKRKSPSKGYINQFASVEEVSIGYMQAGASAISVLTDNQFFGGNNGDLSTARKLNYCPILRKDFIVDEYQIIEAKSIGADAILLIASVLSKEEIKKLAQLAKTLGLEILFEIKNKEEIEKVNEYLDVVGVNNRDLETFHVDIQTSFELVHHIPTEFLKVSESGISEVKTIKELKAVGFSGFLMGETFMRHAQPAQSCKLFIEELMQVVEF